MKKLKSSEIKTYRTTYLTEQKQHCGLCWQVIPKGEEVLDHCHLTGQLRMVLHRGCNCLLGKIENNLKRNKITPEMLTNILLNYESYVNNTKEVLHPTFLTEAEKREKAKKRARKRNELRKGIQ